MGPGAQAGFDKPWAGRRLSTDMARKIRRFNRRGGRERSWRLFTQRLTVCLRVAELVLSPSTTG
jgi:hypothetical protein